MVEYNIKENESIKEYKSRLYRNKTEYDLTNDEVGALINKITGHNWDESAYRKWATPYNEGYDDGYAKGIENNTPTSKLDEIKDVMGELEVKKRQVHTKTLKMNRLKREIIKSVEIAEDIKQSMHEDGFGIIIPDRYYKPVEICNDNEMVVIISDWHIGCVIKDCNDNNFNYDIANERVDKFLKECHKYVNMYDIQKIHVLGIGDQIEHISMRKNQYQYSEFLQGEQINKATKLIFRFLAELAGEFCKVEYTSIAGNHDRMNGDAKANYDGDNADDLITNTIYDYVELSGMQHKIQVNKGKCTDKSIVTEINGKKIKAIHGDQQNSRDGKKILKDEMSMDNEFYDILVQGHWHNFKLETENNGRMVVTNGCLSGYNDYSKKFGCTTWASQTIMVISENEIEMIKGVNLQ